MPQRITIVDGYNVVMARVGIADGLEKARERLVRKLAEKNREPDHSVLVVFDGDEITPDQVGRIGRTSVGVLFSRPPMNADTLILKLMESRMDGVFAEVVTSDGELADKSRKLGARVITVEDFWNFLRSADQWPELPSDAATSAFFKPTYPNAEELAEWEDLFKKNDTEDDA